MIKLLAGYIHAMSLALWFGGLFGYVTIVWPELLRAHAPDLPRGILAGIGSRTAPWIYLAMVSGFLSLVVYWAVSDPTFSGWAWGLYFAVLLGLIANNLYGSFRAWPTIMLAPDEIARAAWRSFYLRMALSLVPGAVALSLTLLVI